MEFIKALIQKIWLQIKKFTFDASNNLLVGINADNVGLAKESTLQTVQTDVSTIKGDVDVIKEKVYDKIDNEGIVRVYAFNPNTNNWEFIEGYYTGTEYTYDSNGNISEVRVTITLLDGTTKTVRRTFSYDANGNLTSISRWEIV